LLCSRYELSGARRYLRDCGSHVEKWWELLFEWPENNIKLKNISEDYPLSRGIKIMQVDVEKTKRFI